MTPPILVLRTPAQVVVLTYKGAVGDINTTEIFNNWGIGKNDLGLLLVLFWEELNEEMHYKEMIVEIGNKMSEYLSAFSLPSCLVLQTMCYHSCFQVLDLVRDFEYQVREENQEVTGLKSNKII